MKKGLIISGGNEDYEFIKTVYDEYKPEIVIAVDRGLKVANKLSIEVNYIVGDFDSIEKEVLEEYREKSTGPIVRKLNVEKDETDTEVAIDLAISLMLSHILIVAATGTRLDHTIANIGLLEKALTRAVWCKIIDKNNLISLHDKDIILKKVDSVGRNFSLIPYTKEVKGLSIDGAKYNLSNYNLKLGISIGISNYIEKDTLVIRFKDGMLLFFETDDEALDIIGKIGKINENFK